MCPAKSNSSTFNMVCMLREWDRSTKDKRKLLLQDFIDQHWDRSAPELEMELAQMASLFLARICVWIKLTYMSGTCLTEQLQVIYIFLSASSGYNYLVEFLEHGGVLCLQELCVSPYSKEVDKQWALRVLACVAHAGTRYKETICECYGIRSVAECMAKSRSEATQEAARCVLELLAEGNPRFADQVYKGLIGVLPCNSPKAQQLALQSIRVLQGTRQTANRALIDRIICILESLHLEVQSAAIELIRDLMKFSIAEDIISALVTLLRPPREIQLGKLFAETSSMNGSSDSDVSDSDTLADSQKPRSSHAVETLTNLGGTASAPGAPTGQGPAGEANAGFPVGAVLPYTRQGGCASRAVSPLRAAPRCQAPAVRATGTRNADSKKAVAEKHVDPLSKQGSINSQTQNLPAPGNAAPDALGNPLQSEAGQASSSSVAAVTATENSAAIKKRSKRRHKSAEPSEVQPLMVFVQQASAAKCLRILAQDQHSLAKKMLQLGALPSLLYTMGNLEFPDSQRQASLALEYLCTTYPPVNAIVKKTMGQLMYDEFMKSPDSHYLQMSPLQADVLVSNKVVYNGDGLE